MEPIPRDKTISLVELRTPGEDEKVGRELRFHREDNIKSRTNLMTRLGFTPTVLLTEPSQAFLQPI